MSEKQWIPLTTADAVIEAIKAGRHVEFTACGLEIGYNSQVGWIKAECKAPYFLPWQMLRMGGLYRALIAPAQPAADDLRGMGVEPSRAKWQPIETAPKDGTLVDLWRPSWGGERLCAYRWVKLANGDGFFEPTISGPVAVRDATHCMLTPEPPND